MSVFTVSNRYCGGYRARTPARLGAVIAGARRTGLSVVPGTAETMSVPLPYLRRPDPARIGVFAITLASFALYSTYSLAVWWRWDLDSFDLAGYHQIVWHLSQLATPATSVFGDANYLGDHFSPILVLWAPLYWLRPTAAMLLLGQAALIAISIPLVFEFARRRVSHAGALFIAIAYAQSWGVWAAVDFAAHEVAFAAPLTAAALLFADRRQWAGLYSTLAALLLVKEDFGLVVLAVGVVLALRGERLRGVAIAASGLAAAVLVNGVVMPAINGGAWSARDAQLFGAYGNSAGSAAVHLATHPGAALSVLTDRSEKVNLLVLLVAAFAGLPLLSGLTLVALPLVLERLVAADPRLWTPSYQYSLVPMVILAMASADGVARLTRWTQGRRLVPEALAGAAVVISVGSAIAFPLNHLFEPSWWRRPGPASAGQALAKSVPPDASLAGNWSLLSHVHPRDGMYLPAQIPTTKPVYAILGQRELDAKGWGYRATRSLGPFHLYLRNRPR